MAYPGREWNVTVFVVDMLGEPAADRVVCLRVFSLDWDDYVADQVGPGGLGDTADPLGCCQCILGRTQ
jgi:hypothetical protein